MAIKSWHSDLLDLTIEIDHDKCTGCNKCVETCMSDVFILVNEKSVCLAIDDCTECCICTDSCPDGVIKHSSCME